MDYLDLQIIDDNQTQIPDFNVILAINEQNITPKLATTTTTTATMITTTSVEKPQAIAVDYSPFFEEIDRKISSILTTITSFSHILVLMLIFTIMTLILIIILFLYILCYHYHSRSIRASRTSF